MAKFNMAPLHRGPTGSKPAGGVACSNPQVVKHPRGRRWQDTGLSAPCPTTAVPFYCFVSTFASWGLGPHQRQLWGVVPTTVTSSRRLRLGDDVPIGAG